MLQYAYSSFFSSAEWSRPGCIPFMCSAVVNACLLSWFTGTPIINAINHSLHVSVEVHSQPLEPYMVLGGHLLTFLKPTGGLHWRISLKICSYLSNSKKVWCWYWYWNSQTRIKIFQTTARVSFSCRDRTPDLYSGKVRKYDSPEVT